MRKFTTPAWFVPCGISVMAKVIVVDVSTWTLTECDRYYLMKPRITLPFPRADPCDSLDLDENFGCGEAADFDQRGAGKIAGEKLLAGAPYFCVLFDVDDIDGHLHDIRHGTVRGLYEVTYLAEDDLCLFVLVAPLDRHA